MRPRSRVRPFPVQRPCESVEQRPKFSSFPSSMVTSLYEWNILKRDENHSINQLIEWVKPMLYHLALKMKFLMIVWINYIFGKAGRKMDGDTPLATEASIWLSTPIRLERFLQIRKRVSGVDGNGYLAQRLDPSYIMSCDFRMNLRCTTSHGEESNIIFLIFLWLVPSSIISVGTSWSSWLICALRTFLDPVFTLIKSVFGDLL